jgi:putative NADPH-quinone reductase
MATGPDSSPSRHHGATGSSSGSPPGQGPATVVVQVHPLEDSYNAALRERVLRALTPPGGLPPPCFRLARGEQPPEAVLVAAERLVLVYPTWSGGLPSALLGWVHDRLDHPADLRRVTRLTAVTTHGSSRFVNRVQGEWGRRYLRTELLACCAPGARFRWLALYKVDRQTQDGMAAHLERVERLVSAR